ncbi:hypothetical protein EHR10_08705 [Leptospira yasudae]|nr:hypothetical protein EHR10_08705 [Leptospira yasudae]
MVVTRIFCKSWFRNQFLTICNSAHNFVSSLRSRFAPQTLTPAPHIALSLRFASRSLRLARTSCQLLALKRFGDATSRRLFR